MHHFQHKLPQEQDNKMTDQKDYTGMINTIMGIIDIVMIAAIIIVICLIIRQTNTIRFR